jgi:hypothetical protein
VPGKVEGRNASALFTTGKATQDWTDVAFVRGTGQEQGWLMVVTDRYKLVYSPTDPPWLFDLERDPDEVINFFRHDGYRPVIQKLSKQLAEYAKSHGDNFAELPRIKADIAWAISGTGEYQEPKPDNPTKRPPPRKRRARTGTDS